MVVMQCAYCLPRALAGGPESLIEQPALMSYYDKSPEERAALGILLLIRLSVGLEHRRRPVRPISTRRSAASESTRVRGPARHAHRASGVGAPQKSFALSCFAGSLADPRSRRSNEEIRPLDE